MDQKQQNQSNTTLGFWQWNDLKNEEKSLFLQKYSKQILLSKAP